MTVWHDDAGLAYKSGVQHVCDLLRGAARHEA